MQHKVIVRFAWGLSAAFVVVAAAFAWAANQREAQLEATAATAEQAASAATFAAVGGVAAGGSAADGASGAPARPDPAAAQAIYDKRCAKCHEPEEMTGYVAGLPADGREAAMFEFLQKHRKAGADDNRTLAAHFTGGA